MRNLEKKTTHIQQKELSKFENRPRLHLCSTVEMIYYYKMIIVMFVNKSQDAYIIYI